MTDRRIPDALLLDLDDTILDDSGSVTSAWWEVCAEAAGPLGLAPDNLCQAIFRVRDWYWSDPERHRVGRQTLRAASADIVNRALQSLGHDDPELGRAIAIAYRDRRDAAQCLLPGAREALATLGERGFPLALITNGAAPSQRAKIERFDLAKYFQYILIEGEFGAGKPDQRVYHHALEMLGSTADDTWMVGDNLEWEIVAPSRLGLGTVWVDRNGFGVPAGSLAQPDHIVRSLSELPRLLE